MHSQVPDFYTDYCGTDSVRAENANKVLVHYVMAF